MSDQPNGSASSATTLHSAMPATAHRAAIGGPTRGTHPVLRPAPEHDELITDITGTLPPGLRGTLYRNGPANWGHGGFNATSIVDGEGLLQQFVLDGTGVRYRSRYVRTPSYQTERGRSVRGTGTLKPGGMLANIGRPPRDPANTHAVIHNGVLLALSDVGRPWEIDPDTLATVGATSFGGALPLWSTFSPHPKTDPLTHEMFNFGLTLKPPVSGKLPLGLRCYRRDRSGHTGTLTTFSLDHFYAMHDFGLTENYLVFPLLPATAEIRLAIEAFLGRRPYTGVSAFHPEWGTKVVLVPRAGGKPRVIEGPPLAYVHLFNAFEDRGDVVFDLIRFNDWEDFAGPFNTPNLTTTLETFPRGALSRVRITPDDRMIVEDIGTIRGEFPTSDWRRTGTSYRYGYHVSLGADGLPWTARSGGVIKTDVETGKETSYLFDAGDVPGEPLFVPREEQAAEDDGWLLCVTYLAAEHRSALVILDARDLEAGPVAVAQLHAHAFPGFHGSFTSRIADPDTPRGR